MEIFDAVIDEASFDAWPPHAGSASSVACIRMSWAGTVQLAMRQLLSVATRYS